MAPASHDGFPTAFTIVIAGAEFILICQEAEMRLFLALVIFRALTQSAVAESQDCKTITDPALRLTCYDKINPPIATYPIPLPKPTHAIPITRPDGTVDYLGGSGPTSEDDALVNAKLHGICRGC
jgi:hypothetical protein